MSKKELHDAFAQGWLIESIEPTRAERNKRMSKPQKPKDIDDYISKFPADV